MKSKIFIALGIAIIAIASTAAIQRKRADNATAPVRVTVVTVQSGDTQSDVMAEGEVIPGNIANVSVLPDYEGRVASVNVDVGSVVHKGQVLAELESYEQQDVLRQATATVSEDQAAYALMVHPYRPEAIEQQRLKLDQDRQVVAQAVSALSLLLAGSRPQQIASAQAAVASAQATLTMAVAQLNRNQQLFDKDLLDKADLETTQTAASVDQAALSEAEQNLSLLQVGPPPQQIDAAREVVASAKLALGQDQQEYLLMEDGSRPEQIEEAAATLAQARAAEDSDSTILQHRFVLSPIDGVVIERNVNPGEVAEPAHARADEGTTIRPNPLSLFVVADNHAVEFIASVDQRYYADPHLGQTADISIEALPGQTFQGVLVRHDPLIYSEPVGAPVAAAGYNPASALTFNVWVRIDNAKGLLVPGQTGLISFHGGDSGVIVPQSAVTSYKLGEGLVYVVKRDHAYLRHVRYGASVDGSIRVLSGLHSGDEVAISNAGTLTDGSSVLPVSASAADDGASAF